MENINIEQVINKWLDMKLKTYDRLEHDESIYLYYEGEEYAEIRIDKKSKFIYFRWKFYEEFSDIIFLDNIDFEGFVRKWVEDTFVLKGFTPYPLMIRKAIWLKMPK